MRGGRGEGGGGRWEGGDGRTVELLSEVCLCLWQLLPVKEIDGSTSQDIFTILNIGEYIFGLIPRLHGRECVERD